MGTTQKGQQKIYPKTIISGSLVQVSTGMDQEIDQGRQKYVKS